jgi:uncharacterized membrane protein YgcG
MSEFNNQPNQRPKTVLNHRALSLYAPNGEGKFANMSFDIKKNDPIITVRTNIAADANNDYGRIQANVPLDKFNMFLSMIEHAAMADQPFRWAYEHHDKKFIGPGKMTDGPVLIYRLVVGREENGVVFISIVLEKRPNIKFSFMPDTKTRFKDGDGNEMPKALESKFLALGQVASLRQLMPLLLKEQYKHPEPKQGGNFGGGGGNRGGQGGGSYGGGGGGGNGGGGRSYSNAGAGADMASDDIPW